MMKIFLNGRFLTHRVTGVERYAREILNELDKLCSDLDITLLVPKDCKYIPVFENIKTKKIGFFKNILWEQISLPLFIKKNKGLLVNLCNTSPIINPGIVCLHDAKIKAKPEFFKRKFLIWYKILFSRAIKKSIRIITVSNFSKNELCKFYKVDRNKIFVIPDAWQHYDRIEFDENTLKKYNLEKNNFYFSMCSLEPNKNFLWIAKAAIKNKTDTFVVSGSLNANVFKDGLGFECPENLKFIGYISDNEAKTLMRDCKAFLFPTFYEGFGIPPLEAFASGCKKIVVSNNECMHEIYEGSAFYVDPLDFDIDLDSIISENRVGQIEILKKYSWTHSAELLYILLKE